MVCRGRALRSSGGAAAVLRAWPVSGDRVRTGGRLSRCAQAAGGAAAAARARDAMATVLRRYEDGGAVRLPVGGWVVTARTQSSRPRSLKTIPPGIFRTQFGSMSS
ncbi:hypothetical protein GCM10022205_44550 [Spinactinospora alkalitolerans]